VTHGAPSGHCGRGAPGVDLVLLRLSFLDSVGMRASLVNRWLLRCRGTADIRLWDGIMEPLSRVFGYRLGRRVRRSGLIKR